MRVTFTFKQPEPVTCFLRTVQERAGIARTALAPLPGGYMRSMVTFETEDWQRLSQSLKALPEDNQPLVTSRGFDIVGGIACLSVRDAAGNRALARALIEMDLESILGEEGEVRLGVATVSQTANQDAIEHAANRQLESLRAQPFRLGGLAIFELLRDGTLAPLPEKRLSA